MAFLTKTDLAQNIRLYKLDQIIDADDTIVEAAAREAESIISNMLYGPGYNTTAILSAVGDARDAQLLGFAKYIAIYKLYERIPDEQVPERVIKNYDDTISELRRISDGRLSMNLPKRTDEDGKKLTKFRWGSKPSRSH